MSSRIDEIIQKYEENIEKIDNQYVLNKTEKSNIIKEISNENKPKNEIKQRKANNDIEVMKQEEKINEIVEIMNSIPMGLEYYEYKKELDKAQATMQQIKEKQATIDQEIAENSVNYVKGETDEDRAKEQKKLAIEREQKIITDRKKEKVILPSGREVTREEKDKIDLNDARNLAIKELTTEKKNIDNKIQIIKMDYNNRLLQMQLFEYKYDIKPDGTRVPLNGDELRTINNKVEDLKSTLDELSKEKEKCEKYISSIKQTFKDDMKNFENALRKPQTQPQVQVQAQEDQSQVQSQPETQPQVQSQPQSQTQPQAQVQVQSQPEEQSELEIEPIFRDESRNREFNGEQGKEKYKIVVGRNVKIYDGKTIHTLRKETLKEGMNISEEAIDDLLREYIDETFAERYLNVEEHSDNIEDTINGSINFLKGQKDLLNPAVLYVIDKALIDSETKKKIISDYIDKAVMRMENNNIDIVYDAKELSKVNIWDRIFKKEINNKEKFELLNIAKTHQKDGSATIEGEYKPNLVEKLIGKITRTQTMALPTQSEIDVAYKVNEYYGEKLSKEEIEEATQDMTKSEARTFKQLIKYNVKNVNKAQREEIQEEFLDGEEYYEDEEEYYEDEEER